MALRNIRLTLAYDGTNYCGWQVQANGPSIQATIERAIEKLTGESCALLSAGRTDSGVHALGQIANFHTNCPIPAQNFRPALQAFLPHDIVVLDSCEAAPEFHSTFAATRKQYRYLIDNSPFPLPFLRGYTYSIRGGLDERVMQEAAQCLAGTHDFRSFETDWPNKVTSVRTVYGIDVARKPLWEAFTLPAAKVSAASDSAERDANLGRPIICLDVVADGFLYNMVRSIVGTLINVGRRKWEKEEVSRILKAQKRSLAGSTVPACGLYLVHVWY
ncbi:MAG TPA: tRNA pseudouridine(38-40) synthase TruA [Planctomycetaceae bacterium]|nr:tRNA pseudouridine(38-40) synthase TruA [Planctomycetaceae bacterium]